MKTLKYILVLSIYLICISFTIVDPDFKILFVGNSLTYTNDLPKLVKKSAAEKGMAIQVETLAYPNYALIDHWKDAKVQKLISNNNYDLVIVQQGPSSQAYGRKILLEYGKKFSDLCKLNNCKLGYFMVWPSREYFHTFEGVIKNYREASKAHAAILFPVGEIWKEHFETTGDFDYYGADQFHPSKKGSLAAAKVIVNELMKLKITSE
ncbi:SGNH/GDSL hydrolase family protein [Christiangramia aquimixticola]|uniref:SGNH/GDSL hydrolase family protein n=1 Tax=Christiangramia aquimixticola TaxID=1697558 RepID=UPI003AA7B6A9